LSARSLDIPIAVDGGIDSVTAPMVMAAGATVLVAGSSVYNQKFSVSDNIQKLQNSLNQK
jgi:ribulose-phosphate 3-epimerase